MLLVIFFPSAIAHGPPNLGDDEASALAAVELSGGIDDAMVSIVASSILDGCLWSAEGLAQAGAERFRWVQVLGTAGSADVSPVFTLELPSGVRRLLEITDHQYLVDLSVSLKCENEHGHSLAEVAAPHYVLAGEPGAVQVLPLGEAMEVYPYGLVTPPSAQLAELLARTGVPDGSMRVLAPISADRRVVDNPAHADRPGRSSDSDHEFSDASGGVHP